MTSSRVVIDTNIFVAAGFNPRSSSARIIAMIDAGALTMVWNEATRRETAKIVQKIPRLNWQEFAPLFRDAYLVQAESHPERFRQIEDRDDRKFAALAHASDAILISNDDHLLSQRGRLDVTIQRPSEFLQALPDW
ncbi:MAG: putative toxin-antitoxin system toxin component, PIN family [Thermomicrobiales bacterium]